MIDAALLRNRADEIDNRLGPIPGNVADRIARELREAGGAIETLSKAIAECQKEGASADPT
jgi:hypothetical protein